MGFPALWDRVSLPENLNKQADSRRRSSLPVSTTIVCREAERQRAEDTGL